MNFQTTRQVGRKKSTPGVIICTKPPVSFLVSFIMSVRPDPNFIPKQEIGPASGWAHGKVKIKSEIHIYFLYLQSIFFLTTFFFTFQSSFEFVKGNRGPKGWQIFLGSSLVIFWGFSRLGAGNKKRAEQKLFERQERYTLVSLLQNEADREYIMREKKLMNQEAKIMSEIPGWQVGKSQYFGSHWTPDHIMDSMKSNQKK